MAYVWTMQIQGRGWGMIWECTYLEKNLLSCSDGQVFEDDRGKLQNPHGSFPLHLLCDAHVCPRKRCDDNRQRHGPIALGSENGVCMARAPILYSFIWDYM